MNFWIARKSWSSRAAGLEQAKHLDLLGRLKHGLVMSFQATVPARSWLNPAVNLVPGLPADPFDPAWHSFPRCDRYAATCAAGHHFSPRRILRFGIIHGLG